MLGLSSANILHLGQNDVECRRVERVLMVQLDEAVVHLLQLHRVVAQFLWIERERFVTDIGQMEHAHLGVKVIGSPPYKTAELGRAFKRKPDDFWSSGAAQPRLWIIIMVLPAPIACR